VTTFNSTKPNVFHYLTFVTFARVPIFRSQEICQFFVDAIRETKQEFPFKLIAWVIMPDHVHLMLNPLNCDIQLIGKTLKGKSAKKILDWLKENGHIRSLDKLKRTHPKKRNHSYSVWQKGVKSVDLESAKFVQQKINYTHLNPVRAGLCDQPAEWKWSSYQAYFGGNEVPIEIDWRTFWNDVEGDGGPSLV